MSQTELAQRTDYSAKVISEIINGKAALTPAMALALERALGTPAHFWNRREAHYREAVARQAERERLSPHLEWLDQIPFKAMAKLGWIDRFEDRTDQLIEVLQFYGVVSPDQWHHEWRNAGVVFRKSPAFEAQPEAVSAWLRRGELEAREIRCAPYDKAAFKTMLVKARGLTTEEPRVFQQQLVALCAQTGVAVVFVPQLPKTRASGATHWLSPTKSLIQLSLRYKTSDHLWFTFFHEAGHILLHGKRQAFIEDFSPGAEPQSPLEEEANAFASEFLIPRSRLRAFRRREIFSAAAIKAFAQELGIAPGIVVGRLQHDGDIPHSSQLNGLKMRLEWAHPVGK